MKPILFLSLALVATLSQAQFQTRNSVTLTGRNTKPLTYANSVIKISNFQSSAPVDLENCVVYIENSTFSTDRNQRPLALSNCRGTIKSSTFDANFKDCDALSIGPAKSFFKSAHRFNYMENGRFYGEPDRNPNWFWTSKTSDVNGLQVWYGLNLDAFANNVSVDKCTFKNAKRAGIFVLYAKNTQITNSDFYETADSRITNEWAQNTLIKGNRFHKKTAFGNNVGVTLWFYNEGTVVQDNQFLGTDFIAGSAGEPQFFEAIGNKGINNLTFYPGYQFNYSPGAWMDYTVRDNEANRMEFSGMRWQSGLNEFFPYVRASDNKVGSGGIRLLGVKGILTNNAMAGGIGIQDDYRFTVKSAVQASGNSLNGLPTNVAVKLYPETFMTPPAASN